MKGPSLLIVVVEVRADRIDQIADVQEIAAANLLLREVRKPDFNEIQPGCAGRNDVQMKARMPLQPALDRRMLVGRVVIHDRVHLDIRRYVGIEHVEKLAKLLVPMASEARADHGLLELIMRRYERASTLLTSNRPVDD